MSGLMSSSDLLESACFAVQDAPRAFLGLLYLCGIAMLGSGIHLFIAYEHEADQGVKNMDFTPLDTTCLITGVTHTYKTIREDRCSIDCGGNDADICLEKCRRKADYYEVCQDTRTFTFDHDTHHTSGPIVTKRDLTARIVSKEPHTMADACRGPDTSWHGAWCNGNVRECDAGGSRDKPCVYFATENGLATSRLINFTDNGKCDDGGENAAYTNGKLNRFCGYGTDETDCGVRDCSADPDRSASRRLAALAVPAGEHGNAPTDAEPLPAGDEDGAHAGAGEHGPRGRRLVKASLDEQPRPTGANLDPRRTTLCPAPAPGQIGDRVPCWRPAEPCGRPGATSGTWEAGPCPGNTPSRYNCGELDCYKIVDPRLEETAHNDMVTPAGQGMAGGVILMAFGGFITAVPFIICLGGTIMLLASCCQGGCKCNTAAMSREELALWHQQARSRESARRLSRKVSRPVMLGGANAAPMRWPSSTTSARIDDAREQLADRGVNSSTHGTVVNDAAIEEELKAQGGHVGRTVNQLMNRTERGEEAQAAQRRL